MERERKSIICPGRHQNTSLKVFTSPPEREGPHRVKEFKESVIRSILPKQVASKESGKEGPIQGQLPPTWGTLALQISAMM